MGEKVELTARDEALARDLHDHIGSSLSLVLRQLELLEPHLARPDVAPQALRRHGAAVATVREALAQTRSLVTRLREPGEGTPLAEALERFAAVMAAPDTAVLIEVDGDQAWIPRGLSDELFLMVRECLRNCFAHAAPRHVSARICIAPHEVQAEVADDGAGFEPAAARRGGGSGLAGLRERIAALDGTLSILSAPGCGTRVTLWFPVVEDRRAS